MSAREARSAAMKRPTACAGSVRARVTTVAPAASKRAATARPMPLVPPVTTATRPVNDVTPPCVSEAGFSRKRHWFAHPSPTTAR